MDESQHTNAPASNRAEIDIGELLGVLWKGKWMIVSIALVVFVVAIVVSLRMPDIYRAEALLAPNDRGGSSSLSTLPAQYGGLVDLAGIRLDNNASDKTATGLRILETWKFIADFVERRDILVPLMAARDWNAATGELEIDAGSYDVQTREWIRSVEPPRQAVPSAQEAFQAMREILSVSQDNKTGFVTVAIEHFSPRIAKQWVDWLIEDLNDSVMREDVGEARQAIAYLEEQIESTSISDLRSVFFDLIEEQTKTMMLAEVTDEYLLKTFDP